MNALAQQGPKRLADGKSISIPLETSANRSILELTQACRRLDWRFLLPKPTLRRVAYFGPPDGTLARALEKFSESFVPFSSAKSAKNPIIQPASFDLVVLASPPIWALESASRLLKPGGCSYVELQTVVGWVLSRQQFTSKGNLWSAGRCVKILRRLGFSEIEAYWHRPNFEACLEIIPLADRGAMHYVFAQGRSDFAGEMKLAAGSYLMKAGLLSHLVPCISLIGRARPASQRTI